MIITVIIGLVVFSVIVLAHELGHFITGKAVGAKIEEFGIGFPPRIFGVRRGETIYSLNAIPFGAFNKFAGEEDPKIPRSLASKGIGSRMLVLSAGSLMNILLPLLLLSIAFMIPHDMVTEPVAVTEVAPGSPAAMAGIETGDRIISLNENPISNVTTLQRYINLNLGREISLLIQHSDSTTEEVRLIPRWKPPEGQGAIGIKIDLDFALSNRTIVSHHEPFWRAIPMGAKECVETFVLYKNGIIGVITGAIPATLTGPVGIVHMMGEVAKVGISPLLEFAALISLVLGIINLFPIPALDGGRIAFVLLEWARRGKRVSPRIEGLIHAIGFAMLIGLMAVITYQDIIRIISGDSLIP
jgi:regulator of sigma E protease